MFEQAIENYTFILDNFSPGKNDTYHITEIQKTRIDSKIQKLKEKISEKASVVTSQSSVKASSQQNNPMEEELTRNIGENEQVINEFLEGNDNDAQGMFEPFQEISTQKNVLENDKADTNEGEVKNKEVEEVEENPFERNENIDEEIINRKRKNPVQMDLPPEKKQNTGSPMKKDLEREPNIIDSNEEDIRLEKDHSNKKRKKDKFDKKNQSQ